MCNDDLLLNRFLALLKGDFLPLTVYIFFEGMLILIVNISKC